MDAIDLQLVNRSDYLTTEQQVLIFGIADDTSTTATAWMVVRDLGIGARHRFSLPATSYVAARDPFKNVSGREPAPLIDGTATLFSMFRTDNGDNFGGGQTRPSNFQAEILNQLPTGSIDALLFKQDQLFAEISGIEPNQTVGFSAVTQLQFQVVEDMRAGQKFVPSGATSLDLSGVESAHIVLSGGGNQPFAFALENVKRASS